MKTKKFLKIQARVDAVDADLLAAKTAIAKLQRSVLRLQKEVKKQKLEYYFGEGIARTMTLTHDSQEILPFVLSFRDYVEEHN